MKSFKIYITEANYLRFLKKNKKLTSDQAKMLDSFFNNNKEAAQDFEAIYGFQSKQVKNMSWDDFEYLLKKYPSWQRVNLKSIKVKGTKGKDYWPMRLKTKKYIANIPLNYKTAQYMNSCKYGTINVNYCIGWEHDQSYWNIHVIKEQKVPVYITDGRKKWVVMILPDNRHYEVWDKRNQENIALINPEPIPNFSIKKELISGKGKLYDEIREDFYIPKENAELIKHFSKTGNTLDIHSGLTYNNSRTVEFFEDNVSNANLKKCSIVITDDEIEITDGTVENLTIADTDCVIRFYETKISGCTIDLSNYNGSEISHCDLYGKNDIDSTYIEHSLFFSDSSKYKECDIRGGESIIYNGYYDRCEINLKKVFGGSFYLCDIKNVLDNVNIKDSKIEECDITNGILKGGSTYIECQFNECKVLDGNTFVGDNKYEDCEIIDAPVESGEYYNTLFSACIIYDGIIKESRLDDCIVAGGFIEDYTIMEDGTTDGGYFNTVTFQNVIINDGKFEKCVIYDDCVINGGDISEDSTVYTDK